MQAQAIDSYRQALALQPGMGEAYWSLANLRALSRAGHLAKCAREARERAGLSIRRVPEFNILAAG